MNFCPAPGQLPIPDKNRTTMVQYSANMNRSDAACMANTQQSLLQWMFDFL
jgi:hypothetical protein